MRKTVKEVHLIRIFDPRGDQGKEQPHGQAKKVMQMKQKRGPKSILKRGKNNSHTRNCNGASGFGGVSFQK